MKLDEIEKDLDGLLAECEEFEECRYSESDNKAERTLSKIYPKLHQLKTLIRFSGIKETKHPEGLPIHPYGSPCLVRVKPCAEEYGGKTFIGFLVGHAAIGSRITIKDDSLVCDWAYFNPMIYIPENGCVVFGYESWWGKIDSVDDLKEITNEEIDSVWYVNLAKSVLENEKSAEPASDAIGGQS